MLGNARNRQGNCVNLGPAAEITVEAADRSITQPEVPRGKRSEHLIPESLCFRAGRLRGLTGREAGETGLTMEAKAPSFRETVNRVTFCRKTQLHMGFGNWGTLLFLLWHQLLGKIF